MSESNMIDLSKVIGVYGLCNTGAVLVHAIDYPEDKVLASINGENPQWCDITEACREGAVSYTHLTLPTSLSV